MSCSLTCLASISALASYIVVSALKILSGFGLGFVVFGLGIGLGLVPSWLCLHRWYVYLSVCCVCVVRWLEVLQMVVRLELPEPVTPSLPQSPLTPGIHAASLASSSSSSSSLVQLPASPIYIPLWSLPACAIIITSASFPPTDLIILPMPASHASIVHYVTCVKIICP